MSVEPGGHATGESTVEVDDPTAGPERRESLARGLGLTLGAQIITGACALLLYRLLAIHTGTSGFASYSLVRQGVSLLFPVVTVGLVGGLPRYLALRRVQRGPPAESYLVAAAVISGVVTLACVALVLVAPGTTALVLFGKQGSHGLVAPFAVLLGGTAAFFLSFGYFRGQLRLGWANGLQIVGTGLLPPTLVLALPGTGIRALIVLMGAGLLGLSIGVVIGPLVRGLTRRSGVAEAGRSLFDYGSRRVPGEIAQLALTALVPVVAAHVTDLRHVAFIAAGIQVMVLLTIAMNPIGVVLLPALAQNWAVDRVGTSRQVGQISAFGVQVGLFSVGQMAVFADLAVRYWLGSRFAAAGAIVRVIVASAPFFVYYLALRSALDAASVRSYNSASNVAALACAALTVSVMLALHLASAAMCVAWGYSVGVAVRGLLTLVYVHRLFHPHRAEYRLGIVVPLVLLTVGAGLATRSLIRGSSIGLVLLAVLELILGAAYFGALVSVGVPWTRRILRR